MDRAALGVCAIGAMLMMIAGCANSKLAGLFLWQDSGPGGDRVVAGSLESVAQSTHDSLRQLGFAAELTQQGESFYISSKSHSGARFALVLTRERSPQGTEQTRIRMQWLDQRDEHTGSQIMARIDAHTKK